MEDPDICERWRAHVLDQQEDVPVEERLTSNMINYVITELEGYSKIADEERGIQQLFNVFKSAAVKLEDSKKDWHPGSNKTSPRPGAPFPLLHCLWMELCISPRRPLHSVQSLRVGPPAHKTGNLDWTQKFTLSQNFAWLPSDFAVMQDGIVHLVSPYINNLHSILHQPLYTAIECILTCFVPLFERVLSDLNTQRDCTFRVRVRDTDIP
ncbi:hypothetical protein B0H17DRAFT_1221959 [Mycena rosella]|uniref:DUF4246 domain-containing protein n=1 Tax=Mycena rosella TaxID=1033263 RepID=A0AAD7AZH9_MYCRO|nr:hypothetical protein B0H17DRAFT_1221959 [Mycena rosella]